MNGSDMEIFWSVWWGVLFFLVFVNSYEFWFLFAAGWRGLHVLLASG